MDNLQSFYGYLTITSTVLESTNFNLPPKVMQISIPHKSSDFMTNTFAANTSLVSRTHGTIGCVGTIGCGKCTCLDSRFC